MAMNDREALAAAIAAALRAGAPVPPLPDDLGLDDGYEIQSLMVPLRDGAPLGGLKAGVTQAGAQRHFGIDHALLGRLYGGGRIEPGVPITLPPGAAIECELGIVVDAQGRPRSFGPAIEFVRAAFTAGDALTAAKLVASNLAADRFLQGPQLPWPDAWQDPGVRLYRDDELVLEAALDDALGGPIAALDWMLDAARARGMALADGMLLMTGCCGPALPAESGRYRADHGPLGSLEFVVA